MPGAKDFITLAFVQDFTLKYNVGENIGLVAEEEAASLECSYLIRRRGLRAGYGVLGWAYNYGTG